MALCLAAAVLWSVPLLAAGLLALLRYSFGSLFVVGERIAATVLHSTGADIASTMERLQRHPWQGVARSGLGLALSLGAVALAPRLIQAAIVVALLGAGWAMAQDFIGPAILLATAAGFGGIALVAPNP